MIEKTVQDWLRGVTYRPGWSFLASTYLDENYVTVRAVGPDVHESGKQFVTGPLFKVPENITREQFYDWLMDTCIPGIETHERWEWFRVNGEHHRDPHALGMPGFATKF